MIPAIAVFWIISWLVVPGSCTQPCSRKHHTSNGKLARDLAQALGIIGLQVNVKLQFPGLGKVWNGVVGPHRSRGAFILGVFRSPLKRLKSDGCGRAPIAGLLTMSLVNERIFREDRSRGAAQAQPLAGVEPSTSPHPSNQHGRRAAFPSLLPQRPLVTQASSRAGSHRLVNRLAGLSFRRAGRGNNRQQPPAARHAGRHCLLLM